MSNLRHSRRAVLQIGFSAALGLGLPSILVGRQSEFAPKPKRARPKSVVLIWLSGGLSQLDTLDPKPEAPREIRSPFQPIATDVPGVRITDRLPRLAKQAKRYALLRTLSHKTPIHEHATNMMLTGVDALPLGASDRASRRDWPHYSAGLNHLRPRTDGLPSGVLLPLALNSGVLWAGQTAGLLGAKHDPLQLGRNNKRSPKELTFRTSDLGMEVGLTNGGLADRLSLLGAIDRERLAVHETGPQCEYGDHRRQAASLLTGGQVARAFDLAREPSRLRDRYGSNLFGQSLLLARRLVEAGVPLVQANMGAFNTWDTHFNVAKDLGQVLLPTLDQAVAAFLDDLTERGLLDETLVLLTGEFGRTPRLGQESTGTNSTLAPGRDHWAGVFSALAAGGGVSGGKVIGRSDKVAAYPATAAYRPSDLGATVYDALGVDPDVEVVDMLGRPMRLNEGKPIASLFNGSGE